MVRDLPYHSGFASRLQGQWQVKGLPVGDYLAIALDYVEDGAWNDRTTLESLKIRFRAAHDSRGEFSDRGVEGRCSERAPSTRSLGGPLVTNESPRKIDGIG